jgi:hypothetical protein
MYSLREKKAIGSQKTILHPAHKITDLQIQGDTLLVVGEKTFKIFKIKVDGDVWDIDLKYDHCSRIE